MTLGSDPLQARPHDFGEDTQNSLPDPALRRPTIVELHIEHCAQRDNLGVLHEANDARGWRASAPRRPRSSCLR